MTAKALTSMKLVTHLCFTEMIHLCYLLDKEHNAAVWCHHILYVCTSDTPAKDLPRNQADLLRYGEWWGNWVAQHTEKQHSV